MSRDDSTLFSALLRHWRTRRGLSQLDLSVNAEVSSRHISFLETGRAQPSREMVLILGAALGLPFRDQNALLRSAGFQDAFAEPNVSEGLTGAIARTVERMLAKHEPYPLVVMSGGYDLVRANHAATKLLGWATLDPSALKPPGNLFRTVFDPRLARTFIPEWERVARWLINRLHREALARPNDAVIGQLLRDVLAYPDVPASQRQPDFTDMSDPVLAFRIQRDGRELSFLSTVTHFDAPQNVTLEELKIESFYPLDDATAEACEQLLR
ncbi:MAG TPA: helix-turn-helix transcriptional regulator [Polyangiales bacterium]|nr:helix-turn-helix transcriptional regulator [Polyangiales bacterium]